MGKGSEGGKGNMIRYWEDRREEKGKLKEKKGMETGREGKDNQ